MSELIQNGTTTAHSRTWPLYERMTVQDGVRVMELFMSPEDRAEKEALDEAAIRN